MKNLAKVNNVKAVKKFLNTNGFNQFDNNFNIKLGILGMFKANINEVTIIEFVKKLIK